MPRRSSFARLVLAGACAFGTLHATWAVHAALGTPVADVQLKSIDGAPARVLGDGVSVLVFFRAGQDRSGVALRELARCKGALAGKAVRWVGLVSDAAPIQGAAELVRAAGFDAPVLVDPGDALYGQIGLALHPVVVVVGRDRRLAAFEPFRAVDFCAVVTARVRHALGEIGDAELRALLEPPRSAEGGDEQVAARYRALARAQLQSGSLDKAQDSIRRSLEKAPEAAASHLLLGEILAAQGRCAEALEGFRKALALEPSNAAARRGIEGCGGR